MAGTGGAGGGTYGGMAVPGVPATGGSSLGNPLALTGQTADSMANYVLDYNRPIQSQNALPTDPIHLDPRSMGRGPGQGMGVALPGTMTYGDAQGLPGQWFANDPKFYKQFMGKLILYKYPSASADMGIQEATSAWDDLLQTSIMLNKTSKGKQWTPWDVLETYNNKPGSLGTRKVGDWLVDIATGEKVKYVGPRTKTQKQTALDLSNPEQVQALATQTLTQMIGRAPTDKELAQFKATLNGYEREHPQVTTTTQHLNDQGEVTNSDVVQTGGVDDAARATVLGEGIQKTKEYGKYQAGTTYFNALMQMIGGG